MKHEESRSHEGFVLVPISPNDLAMIGHILYPYAQLIRRIVPPSKDRGVKLTVIENLRRRIADFNKGENDGKQFSLTLAELHIIDAALTNFVSNVRHFFPKSQERDETLTACESLRQYLVASFVPRGDGEKNSQN